ncbi:MAG: bi-domain-containing oxidoreductase [Planctomycetota bacterium]
MKQVLIRQGTAMVEEVPAPRVEPGTVLVRTLSSCISTGTELSGMKASGQPLWRRAMARPDQVRKALALVAEQGVARTWEQVQGRLQAGSPGGYSLCGIILEVGPPLPGQDAGGSHRLAPGELVACAGAQCANHAEIVRVPYNLTVPVPKLLSPTAASTAALGAIALHGVHRARPEIGECFVVVGAGILGQLAAQILRAAGCRVVVCDLDRRRLELARSLGAEQTLHPDDGEPAMMVANLTAGVGADGVLVCASSPDNAAISLAFRCCRKKARVVLVGDVGLDLKRSDIYEKELDLLISTSYGPGRYDRGHEEGGLDYPVAYVRWTEGRNLSAYLDLLATGKIVVAPLVSGSFPAERAADAYTALTSADRPLCAVLEWPSKDTRLLRTIVNPHPLPVRKGTIGLGLIGAGDFARAVHLPNLRKLRDRFQLHAIACRNGHRAMDAAARSGAATASTDPAELLADPRIEAVLIATRHHLHAGLVETALRAGRHVLVEKPLCLSLAELTRLEAVVNERATACPVLLTGYNRRFSPLAVRCRELLHGRGPMQISCRVNAGRLAPDHWTHGPEGGGRNRGEACHFYDLFTFLCGGRLQSVQATALRPTDGTWRSDDNFSATIRFNDGSIAALQYTAMGDPGLAKERIEVFAGGLALVIDDWRSLDVHGAKRGALHPGHQDKGHLAELQAFANAVRSATWPIAWWEQIQSVRIAEEVERQLHSEPPRCAD